MTPVYDLLPHLRTSYEVRQAMDIGRAPTPDQSGDRDSKRTTCVNAAGEYNLGGREAAEIFDRQIDVIAESWRDVADEVGLTREQADSLFGTTVLPSYALT